MTAARPFGRVDAIVHATSKLRQVWLSLIAMLVSAVLSLPSAHAAPGDVDALNLNIVGSFVYASAVQPDGKTIIGGQFSSVLGQARNNIARLNADGTLDAGFNPNANGSVESVALQADGQILLGGFFTTIAGSTRNRIARVAADGTLDAGFNPNANGNVRSIAVQADGQILLGGDFTTVGGSTRNRIARVAANGTLDAGFNPNANATVYSIAIQADGQILLGGSFITIGGSTRNFIARVAANGTLDASFTPNANFDVISIAVQANGQILFVGFFTTVNGVTRDRIARLAANGTLDMGFNPVPNSNVFSIALQADGRILFGGEFTSVGGTTRNRIARVAADGMLDLGFNPNVNGDVRNITLQANGQILLGDVFTTVGGSPRNRFARLLNDPATQSLSAVDTTQVLWTRGGSAPELGQATFELSTNGGVSYTPLGGIATRVGSTANWQLTGLSLPASGQLRARGRTAGGFGNGSTGLVEQVASFSGLGLVPAITEFTAGISASALPRGIAAGADGNVWFTQESGNRIGRVTPLGVITEFSAGITSGAGLIGITGGPDGNVWFTEFSLARIGRITPAGTVTEFASGVPAQPLGITSGPDGALWFTSPGSNGIGRITTLGVVTTFTAGITSGSSPDSITTGPDGNLWFTERIGNRLARITTAGVVTEFSLPGVTSPMGIATGPDNQLWFGYVGGIGKMTTTGVLTLFTAGVPAGSNEGITNGGDGYLYFTNSTNTRVGRISTTGAVALFTAGLSGGAQPKQIARGPDGNLWFAQYVGNRIGRLLQPELSYYPFENNSMDSSPGGRNGVDTSVVYDMGRINTAARFNNSNSKIEVAALANVLPSNNAPRAVAFWMRRSGPDNGNMISWGVQNNNQRFSILHQAGGRLDLIGQFNDYQSSATLLENRWYHVAVNYSASSLEFFVDGASAGTFTPSGINTDANQPLRMGVIAAGPDLEFYGGLLDEVHVYGRTLTTPEIQVLTDPPGLEISPTMVVNEDAVNSVLPFNVYELQNLAAVTVTANSSNAALLPNGGNLQFGGGTGEARTLTLQALGANLSGTSTLILTATDLSALTVTRSVLLTVNPVNDPPVFTKGSDLVVNEDAGPQSIPSWATVIDDGDSEVQNLSFVVTGNSSPGIFLVQPSVSPTGTLSFQTNPNSNGSATISLVLNDDGGTANGGIDQSAVQTFNINITPVNDAPSFAAGPNQMLLEDAGPQSIAGWATAIDDGEPVAVQTLTFVVTPISGTVNFSVFPTVSPTGTLSYTTDIDSVGSATFSVRLDDNGGTANGGLNQSALQNFTISVGPVNDAPSFAVGAAISPHFEDPGPQSVPGWAIAVDDGDPETVQTLNFVVTPISGTLNFSMPPTVSLAGTLSYTPAPNSFGSATFSVRLDDNGGTANGGVNQSAPQNLTINVGSVNDAPTFVVGANQSVFEDIGAVSVPAWASTIEDGDPETVQTLNFVVTPISGTVNFSVFPTVSSTGTLSYTTDIDSVGSATFSVRLDDDGGTVNGGVNQSALQNFTISVGPVNDAPSFAVGAAISPHFEDPGPQSVPGWAIAVDDGDPETVQTLNFVVTPISGTLNFSMPPTVSLTGTLSYTPAPNSFGSATFSVRLDDNGGTANGGVNQSAALNFTIDVFAVNDAPTFVVGANQTTFEDIGAVTVPGWATVDDGDPEVVQTLSFEITAISGTVSLSAGPTISPSGTLSYTPAPNSFGSATITIRVNDDGGLVNGGVNQSTTQNFTISVIAVNDAPSFVAGANQNVLEDAGSVTVPGWATAIDWNDGGVVQSVTFAVTPISGTVNFSVFPTITPTGQLSYTPAPNSAGSATFAVVAMDNGGTANGGIDQSPPQNFTINVASVNDAPSFVVGANQNVLEDAGAISVPNWATALDDGDPESPQNLNFTLISNSNPTLFSAAPSISPTGALSYTSVANASGSATISLRLNDDGGTANGGINQSAPQNFTITVAPVNDVPSFVVGTNQVLPPGSNAPQAISNWASAISDGDTDFTQALSFTVTNDRNSMFSTPPAVAANGTLSFTPNGTAGRAIVSVSLTDDANAGGPALTTPVQTFSIIVRGIPTVTIEQRSPAATVVGEPFSVRVRVLNPTSSFQATGMITVALLPSGNPVQCTLAPIATPPGAAEAICNNVISPIATAKLVQASYNGDAVFALGEGLSQHPVDKAATRLTILEDLPDPSMSNSPVAVRYLLEVLPPSLSAISDVGGEIRLSYGQTDSSLTPVSSTNPIALITMQGNGSNPLTASYTGDGNFLNSTVATPEPHTLIGGNNSDLAVAISNSRRFVPIAGETIYQVRVSNLGSISSSAQLDAFVPEGLDNYRWTCSASAGSSCHAPSGNGTIVAGINILAGGNVTYTIRADVSAAEATLVRNSVRITPALSPPDANPANDTATDTDVVAVFVEGFEE